MNTDPVKNTGHYIHRMTYNYRERMVGLFVFSALVLFLVLIAVSGKSQHLFENRVTFYIDVNSGEGISQGNVVKALGTDIGTVSNLSVTQGRKIRVTIEVYEGQRTLIRTDAMAIVNRLSNIGNAMIEIKPGSIDASELPEGASISVEETPSLNELLLSMANIIQTADNKNLLTKFENILPELEKTIENVHKIITQIATGHGTLGAAIFDQKVEKEMKTVVTSGSKMLSDAEGIISIAKQRLNQIEPLLNDASYIAHDLRGVSQNLPNTINQLNKVILQVETALTMINGELRNIPGVALDTKRAMTKADRLLDSVQSTWPLSTKDQKPTSKQLIPPHPIHE